MITDSEVGPNRTAEGNKLVNRLSGDMSNAISKLFACWVILQALLLSAFFKINLLAARQTKDRGEYKHRYDSCIPTFN